MFLADELVSKGIRVDVGRVLRMALLHDWAEARIGDMPRTAITYFGADARKSAESAAFADMMRGFNDGNSYQDLYQEYEQRQTLEARLVKAADVIDLLVQTLALERTGARGLDEFWEVARNPDFQLDAPADQLVAGILESLLEERRKLTIDAL
jgi:putative hydrolase of HD superfamily